ncbi:hypothetical protein AB3N59_12280 [Leptospira sp. WS92.C1]
MIRTVRCTFSTGSGITTRSYYLDVTIGYGFIPSYAEQTGLQPGFDSPNPDKAIFQIN